MIDQPPCPHGGPVFWNPFNRVVQCHACGIVFAPIPLDANYGAAVKAAWPDVLDVGEPDD